MTPPNDGSFRQALWTGAVLAAVLWYGLYKMTATLVHLATR
jgi:hypothetical protein